MEKYFNIRYLFGKEKVWAEIDRQIGKGEPGYICVADGNVVNNVQHSEKYREVLDGAMFSICDSGWIPVYLKWIYGIRREQYCGPQIFKDLVEQGKHRMLFMGTNQKTLDALKQNLVKVNPDIASMTFYELPFRKVEEFDYPQIARMVNEDGADIIWVALGAPKQENFMSRLKPHLSKGVMLGVGAVFNFYSGIGEKRAPQWVVKAHVEFLYRIKQAPKKQIKRCWGIITGMPGLLGGEYRRKKSKKNQMP